MARGRATGGVTINLQALASWMDREQDWLGHVVEYNFGCGCDFNYEDIQSCAIWRAQQAKEAAEEALEKAKTDFNNATAINPDTLTMEDL